MYLSYAIMDHKLLRDLVLLSLLTSLYMLFGAVVFQTLENRLGEDLTTKNLTESLEKDLLQKFNATRQELVMILARVREIVGKESNAQKTEWTLYSSLYFVGSVITTIGYGHISPRTAAGRLFCIFFAIIGIPLNLLTLKALGDGINELLTKLITNFERKVLTREPARLKIKTMIFSALLMVLELILGGVLYNYTEDWDFLASVYYCFVVFSTIGFGDLVPNQGRAPTEDYLIGMIIMRAALLIIGLSTLSSVLTSVVCAAEEINATIPKFCCIKKRGRVRSLCLRSKQSRDDNPTHVHSEPSGASTTYHLDTELIGIE